MPQARDTASGRLVQTEFGIKDSASTALGQLSSAFGAVGGTIGRVMGMINPLTAALGVLGGGLSLSGVVKVGAEFEQLQIGMAQTLKFMGSGGRSFEEAMSNAELVLKRVRADAGPLPGEAEDYAKALQLAGATTQKATGNFEQSYQLVRDMSAIAISIGGSAELGAVELNRMLNGGRGMMHMQSDFSMKILQAMRQMPGYANLTSHEFNRMDLGKRLALLQGMTRQFDDMVGAQTKTWAAVEGAAQSTFKIMFAAATQPLFDAAKTNLGALNSLLIDAKGELTTFGQSVVDVGRNISTGILAGFARARDLIVDISGLVSGIGSSSTFAKLTSIGAHVAAQATGGSGMGGPAGGVGIATAAWAALSGVALPMVAIFGILGSTLYQLVSNTQFLTSLFDQTTNLLGAFVQVVGPISDYFQTLGGILADLISAVLPPLIGAFAAVLDPVLHFAGGILTIGSTLYAVLRPALMALWQSVGGLVESIGNFLNPVIRILGAALTWIFTQYTQYLIPVVSVVIEIFKLLIDGIKSLLNFLGSHLSNFADKLDKANPKTGAAGTPGHLNGPLTLDDATNLFSGPGGKHMFASGGPGQGPITPTTVGGGGRTVQDFRYSRFDITQKFAEGFDPDRISVAFAQDIGRLGSERLQSGHEPMYALR